MKLRILTVVLAFLIILTGCSLAEDVTPPPDYRTPTPAPTLAALVPFSPPSPARGAAFYLEDCAPCHGQDGLGNGPLAAQLPVAVPAISLREIASQSSPSAWFQLISIGRIERGMPGFSAHPQADRWDVLAYVYSLGSQADELQLGESLFAAQCADCHGPLGDALPNANLSDPAFLSGLSGLAIYRSIAEGGDTMPAFADRLTEAEIWALAAHLRQMTFDLTPIASPTPEALPTQTVPPATPQVEATATGEDLDAVQISPTPQPQVLSIHGLVTNGSGSLLPNELLVTLHVFDMQTNAELQTQTALVAPDGAYAFDGLEAQLGTAFWVSLDHQGISYASEPAMYDGTVAAFELPIRMYDVSADQNLLSLDQVHLNISLADEATLQVVEIYILSNPSSMTILVPSDGMTVPFIQLPVQAANVQYQLANGSESLLGAQTGFAMPPSAGQYGIVAIYSLPYERRLEFQQSFPLPVNSLVLFVPEGLKVRSEQLTDGGSQEFQGQTFSLFQADNLAAGSTLALTVSNAAGGFSLDRRTATLIGLGAAGLLLIAAGVYLYIRDRRMPEDLDGQVSDADGDALGEDQDAILDAILALEDRFKAGEISAEAYATRRAELKSRLQPGKDA